VVTPQSQALSSVASGGVAKKRLKQNKGFRVKKNGEELADVLLASAAAATAAAACTFVMGTVQTRREALTPRHNTHLPMLTFGLLTFAAGASLLACAALEEDESSSDLYNLAQ
jgi:hypothetical protein